MIWLLLLSSGMVVVCAAASDNVIFDEWLNKDVAYVITARRDKWVGARILCVEGDGWRWFQFVYLRLCGELFC